MEFFREKNYSSVGLDLMVVGGEGGEFDASREAWEFGLKRWLGSICVSFGLLMIFWGGLQDLGSYSMQ